VYEYYFQRDLPAEDDDKYPEMDGAFHSADLWYMFGTLKKSWRPFTEADTALSEKMLDAWTGFAISGTPGWAPSVKGAVYKEVLDITPTR
nr:carboxylesterase family protein [Bacteroidales bacterium]